MRMPILIPTLSLAVLGGALVAAPGRRPAAEASPAVVSTEPVPTEAEAKQRYPWPRRRAGYDSLASRFPTPSGFTRVAAPKGSYADWLRHLPLLARGTPVRDYGGRLLPSSTAAAVAVVDLDVGARDLQQCMDTIMRLRGEYLWWRRQAHKVRFRYAGGRYFGWSDWAQGIRPKQKGGRVVYEKSAGVWVGRGNFQRYLTFMFAMTGTAHAVAEPKGSFATLAAGDFFVQPPPTPGSLGHAVVVLDVARSARGEVRALLGEGYTPAQDLHVLKAPGGGAWYRLRAGEDVKTPQWPAFAWSDFRRFRY